MFFLQLIFMQTTRSSADCIDKGIIINYNTLAIDLLLFDRLIRGIPSKNHC